jgi:hypothetical protein
VRRAAATVTVAAGLVVAHEHGVIGLKTWVAVAKMAAARTLSMER